MRQRQRQELQSSSVVSTAISHLGGLSQNFFQINRHEKMGVRNSCQLPRGAKRQANDEKKRGTLCRLRLPKGGDCVFQKVSEGHFLPNSKKENIFDCECFRSTPGLSNCGRACDESPSIHPLPLKACEKNPAQHTGFSCFSRWNTYSRSENPPSPFHKARDRLDWIAWQPEGSTRTASLRFTGGSTAISEKLSLPAAPPFALSPPFCCTLLQRALDWTYLGRRAANTDLTCC